MYVENREPHTKSKKNFPLELRAKTRWQKVHQGTSEVDRLRIAPVRVAYIKISLVV